MLKYKGILCILLLFAVSGIQAQSPVNTAPASAPFKPTIGLGTGVFSFYGEVGGNGYENPMLSRIGYDLSVSQRLSHFLDFRFYVLFGKLGANERSIDRNYNFESTIRAGGLHLCYNFGNFLPAKRKLSPFITAGIESFEFLSKTDKYDSKGNRYYYWSDGSIRNIDQNSPDAEKSQLLTRDYIYETDIRESNEDGFGKYAERSFSIPVGAGIIMHLSDRVDFKIGSTLHFALTDYIDGLTAESKGRRAGNKQNDRFLMSSFSVTYDLVINKDEKNEEDAYDTTGAYLADNGDEDGDGVNDYKDLSPFTPAGEPVDSSGVPLDNDKDRVFNYQDDEIMSTAGAIVTTKGVELTDSLIEAQYLQYIDSTGAYAKTVRIESEQPVASSGRNIYEVQIGTFKTGVPQDLMNKYLSINDVSSTSMGDSSTVYTAGKYTDYKAAEQRRDQLIKDGIENASVVLHKDNKFTPVNGPVPETKGSIAGSQSNGNNGSTSTTGNNNENSGSGSNTNQENKPDSTGTVKEGGVPNTPGVVYRVQVGAYKRKVSKQVYSGISDLLTLTGNDGITRYLTGNFTDYNEAAKRKVDMLVKGFEGAFIVAYKDGERVTLTSTGVQVNKKADEPEVDETNKIRKDMVVFKVQIGVFKNDVPADIKEKFNALKGIETQYTTEGLARYTAGSFNSYEDAVKLKADITKNKGIPGAFVVAFFNGRLIDVQEALELLK